MIAVPCVTASGAAVLVVGRTSYADVVCAERTASFTEPLVDVVGGVAVLVFAVLVFSEGLLHACVSGRSATDLPRLVFFWLCSRESVPSQCWFGVSLSVILI